MARWRQAKTREDRETWTAFVREIMPEDDQPPAHHVRWLLREDGQVVAACSAAPVERGQGVYLSIACVRGSARGRGLQSSAVRLRERWARRQGATWAITYTACQNAASMRTLIRCGYRPYSPVRAWVGRRYVYWRRRLTRA